MLLLKQSSVSANCALQFLVESCASEGLSLEARISLLQLSS